MYLLYQKIFRKLQSEAFVSILSIFHFFWVQTVMDQHKNKKKNVFFRKKDPFECMRDI